jgi:hypothetical protein
MARSRTSPDFDLANAIAAAMTLSDDDKTPKAAEVEAKPEGLASFGAPVAGTPDSVPPPPPPPPPRPRGVASISTPPPSIEKTVPSEASRTLPKLPDLSNVKDVLERCERIVQWIGEATGATNVFLADAAGLPLAGSVNETEARLAGSGLVAASIGALASSMPGTPSPQFELTIGEGPYYQVIGFQGGNTLFIVGLNRNTPLTSRQAHAIRLACRYALGEMTG